MKNVSTRKATAHVHLYSHIVDAIDGKLQAALVQPKSRHVGNNVHTYKKEPFFFSHFVF